MDTARNRMRKRGPSCCKLKQVRGFLRLAPFGLVPFFGASFLGKKKKDSEKIAISLVMDLQASGQIQPVHCWPSATAAQSARLEVLLAFGSVRASPTHH